MKARTEAVGEQSGSARARVAKTKQPPTDPRHDDVEARDRHQRAEKR